MDARGVGAGRIRMLPPIKATSMPCPCCFVPCRRSPIMQTTSPRRRAAAASTIEPTGSAESIILRKPCPCRAENSAFLILRVVQLHHIDRTVELLKPRNAHLPCAHVRRQHNAAMRVGPSLSKALPHLRGRFHKGNRPVTPAIILSSSTCPKIQIQPVGVHKPAQAPRVGKRRPI